MDVDTEWMGTGEYRDPILETLCYLYLICPLHISPYLYGAQSTQIQHAGQMQCKMFDKRRYRGGGDLYPAIQL